MLPMYLAELVLSPNLYWNQSSVALRLRAQCSRRENRQWRRFITISSITLNAATDLGRESRQTEWMASRKRSTFDTKTARYRCRESHDTNLFGGKYHDQHCHFCKD